MKRSHLKQHTIACSRGHKVATTARAMWFVTLVVAFSPSMLAFAQNNDADDLSQIARQLTSAIKTLKSDSTLENRIRLATWRLLFAESATERADSASLWTLATDQFVEGIAELQEIENSIAKSPDLERKLSETPAIAMRLDAARVRQPAIEQRAQLARESERQRLNQLRAISKQYRDVLTKMSELELFFRLEDFSRVRSTSIEVLTGIGRIHELVGSRKDYHLFDDEPALDNDQDLKLVQSAPAPLNVELIAHLKATHAFATCRLALASEPPDNTLLNHAKAWANAAVQGTAVPEVDLPTGHAADNPLAHYVLGRVNEGLGVLLTSPNRASAELHQRARPLFDEAITHYKRATDGFAKATSNNKVLASLTNEVTDRIKSLESIATFLSKAEKETLAGRPKAAWDTLTNATMIHRNQQLWLELLEAGRRAEVGQNELQQATKSAEDALLSRDDCSVQLVFAKSLTDAVWSEIGRKGIARLTSERRVQLGSLLAKQSDELRKAIASEQVDLVRVQGNAFLSLAITYQSLLAGTAEEQKDSLREAHRLSRDAMASLELALSKEENEYIAVSLREALIASRLAYGHISVLVLPDYRDDAVLAFAAAFDEMAKLQFRRADVSALGSPMISAMAARTGESGTKLVFEERRYRDLVTRFVEAMYTLQFGNAAAAADQMATALQIGYESGDITGQSGPKDASVMLGQTDGFDAQVTLQDSVRAFTILADVEAGRTDKALVDSLRVLVPHTSVKSADEVDPPALTAAIERIQSPLVGFAFASALEANVNTLQLEQQSRRQIFLTAASTAFNRVQQQLSSQRMQTRYPHLVALVSDALQRLGSVDIYRDKAKQLRSRGDLKGAEGTLVDGLRRHPKSTVLWQLYLETQIEQARRGDVSTDNLKTLLDRIGRIRAMNMISAFEQHFYSGLLHERLGDIDSSLQSYQEAVATAEEPQDRVLARSKVSQLRVRIAARN